MVLALVVSGLGLVVGAAAPASACSCISANTARYVQSADVIVTGTLVDIGRPPRQEVRSSIDPVTYLVDVESTYKGEAGPRLEFTSALMGASCGVEGLEVDRRYTFFLHRLGPRVSRFAPGEPGDLVSGLCSGNRGARDALDRRITALTGPPVSTTDVSSDAAPDVVPAPMPTVSEGGEWSDWWLPATGAFLTGLAGIGVLVWRRRTGS